MTHSVYQAFACCLLGIGWWTGSLNAEQLSLQLTRQSETSPQSGRYHRISEPSSWDSSETALILCDVWDSHTCQNAVLRLEELVPRLVDVTQSFRKRGVTIIHAPSQCMEFYREHPARLRAMKAPEAKSYPEKITEWCRQLPVEESVIYPIDQSNGGNDDSPAQRESWVQTLRSQGRDLKTPWRSQHPDVPIDPESDFITDSGQEVWRILEARGIKNVVLVGVHTNMCVLGRPFGLRQMVRAGKRTALFSDLTDTMYDPQSHPQVSHFTGTDLIIDHIERHICPTLTSDQIVGGKPIRFSRDKRPTIGILIAEDEYKTESTLPEWSLKQLGKDFRIRLIFGSDQSRSTVPGLEAIRDADLLMVSARRRPLLKNELQLVRDFAASKRPMLGIRTANHAFSIRKGSVDPGVDQWPEFDAEVWGGSYTNHYGREIPSTIRPARSQDHPLLKSWAIDSFVSAGSLYIVTPLKPGAQVVLNGSIPDKPEEPVAWSFRRASGGLSFYTSLGHPDDFQNQSVATFLGDAARWLIDPSTSVARQD
jgi:nicotinamidase-related amidase/type 1 glutamine amidotransferase